MAHFLPLPKLPFAKETAKLVVHLCGIPIDVVSDIKESHLQSVVGYYQFVHRIPSSSNGQGMRMNQDLVIALYSMVFRDPTSWFPNLVCVEHLPNFLASSASGLSPFFVCMVIIHLCSLH